VLFGATTDQNIRGWKVPRLEAAEVRRLEAVLMLRGHASGVNGLASGPEAGILFSAGRDGMARRWRVRDDPSFRAGGGPFAECETYQEPDWRHGLGLAVSPNQRVVALSHFSSVSLLDIDQGRTGQVVRISNVFRHPSVGVHSVAFLPDGAFRALGAKEGWIGLLDATTLKPVRAPLQVLGATCGIRASMGRFVGSRGMRPG
jgi:WD40 repeat protein